MCENISGLYRIDLYDVKGKIKGIYIGITNNFKARVRQHKYHVKHKDKNYILYNKMSKYKYKIKLLFKIDDRELLNEMEHFYIKEIRKLNSIECYNMTDGGDGINGIGAELDMYSLDGKYIRSFKTGNEAIRYLNVTSTSSIFACAMGKYKVVSAFGYVWRYKGEDFYKYGDIINDRYLGRSKVKKVYKYDLKGNLLEIYDSCMDVERKSGFYNTSISRACRGEENTAYGSVWRYEGDGFDKYTIDNKCRTKVDKYNIKGTFIKTYNSLKEAELDNIEYKVKSQNIYHCCKGDRRSSGGFIWRYHNDPFDKYPTNERKQIKKVKVFDLDYKLLYVFSSRKEVERELGIPQYTVSDCCLGKKKSYQGYIFEYANKREETNNEI